MAVVESQGIALMPLSEQERQEILARRQGGTSTPPISGTLPPDVQQVLGQMPAATPYMAGATVKGMRMNLPKPTQETERELLIEQAKQLLKNKYPVQTETERASTRVAKIALQNVNRIRQQLGVNAAKGTVRDVGSVTATITPPEFLGGRPLRNPMATTGAKQLRDDLENSFALLALLRTGKQGEVKQISNIRDTHNIGFSEEGQPQTIIRRLQDLENELKGFASGEIKSPMDAADTPSTDLSADESAIVQRLLGR